MFMMAQYTQHAVIKRLTSIHALKHLEYMFQIVIIKGNLLELLTMDHKPQQQVPEP